MQSNARAYCVLSGLALMAFGCHSPYGYGPYGYNGYYGQPYQPQYPSTPVYTIPPGGTPGLGAPSPTPLTNPSPSPTPTPTYDPNGINWQPNQPNGAPTYTPNPAPTDTGNRQVPDPADDLDKPSASKPALQPTSSTQRENDDPFAGANASQIPPVQVGAAAEDVFEQPLQRTTPIQQTSSLQKANIEAASERLSPYGRDLQHANPQWLRGVIDYDKRERSWHIIYSETPDPRDPNGGSLTLGAHPDLAFCRDGEMVRVEGAIDASQTDARGKPIYVLDGVTKLMQ